MKYTALSFFTVCLLLVSLVTLHVVWVDPKDRIEVDHKRNKAPLVSSISVECIGYTTRVPMSMIVTTTTGTLHTTASNLKLSPPSRVLRITFVSEVQEPLKNVHLEMWANHDAVRVHSEDIPVIGPWLSLDFGESSSRCLQWTTQYPMTYDQQGVWHPLTDPLQGGWEIMNGPHETVLLAPNRIALRSRGLRLVNTYTEWEPLPWKTLCICGVLLSGTPHSNPVLVNVGDCDVFLDTGKKSLWAKSTDGRTCHVGDLPHNIIFVLCLQIRDNILSCSLHTEGTTKSNQLEMYAPCMLIESILCPCGPEERPSPWALIEVRLYLDPMLDTRGLLENISSSQIR